MSPFRQLPVESARDSHNSERRPLAVDSERKLGVDPMSTLLALRSVVHRRHYERGLAREPFASGLP
jgi:hypothetical protein